MLVGGLAAGSFEGVNKLAGWDGAATVEAASNKNETTLTFAKSEKEADSDESDLKQMTVKIQAARQQEAWIYLISQRRHFHLSYLSQLNQFRKYRAIMECTECMDMLHSSRNRK